MFSVALGDLTSKKKSGGWVKGEREREMHFVGEEGHRSMRERKGGCYRSKQSSFLART